MNESRKEALGKARKALVDSYDNALKRYDSKINQAKDKRSKRILEIAKQQLNLHKQNQIGKIDEQIKVSEGALAIVRDGKTGKVTQVISSEEVKNQVLQDEKTSMEDAIAELGKKVDSIQTTTKETHKEVKRLSSKKTWIIGFLSGVGASSAVWFLTTILPKWLS